MSNVQDYRIALHWTVFNKAQSFGGFAGLGDLIERSCREVNRGSRVGWDRDIVGEGAILKSPGAGDASIDRIVMGFNPVNGNVVRIALWSRWQGTQNDVIETSVPIIDTGERAEHPFADGAKGVVAE